MVVLTKTPTPVQLPQSFYEQKMAEMVKEMHTALVDRDRLVKEIEQIEKKAAAGGDTSDENGRLTKLSRDPKLKEEELQRSKTT